MAALLLASVGASAVQAQSHGTDGEAASSYSSIDSNGTHPGPKFDCSAEFAGPGWCGSGARSSDTGYSNATIGQQQGFLSGSLSATNAQPPGRVFSAANLDAHWFDTFTVESASLPADAIVDLMMTVDLRVTQFTASAGAPPPYTNVIASMNLGGPDAPAIAGMNVFGEGSYLAQGFLQVQLGVPFVLWATYFSQSNVNETPAGDVGSTAGFANYYVDILGLANLQSASILGDSSVAGLSGPEFGLHMITDSGHDYSSIPRPSGAPEPAAWTMLIAGFGLAGRMLRRRRLACV